MQTGPANLSAETRFRKVLENELLKRCRANRRYSLRAFAKSLQVSPASLSGMLSGKRPITRKMKLKLGLALGIPLAQLAPAEPARLPGGATLKFGQITLDAYAIVSDWYHYAILELIRVRGFKPDVRKIARSLDITVSETRIAVQRLQSAGLLEIRADGQWIDRAGQFATNIESSTLTTAAAKKMQRQILQKSLKSLDEHAPTERNHTGMTMAINPERLPEAIDRIRDFRRSLCAFLEADPAPTRVYQLALSLYPVSQPLDVPGVPTDET